MTDVLDELREATLVPRIVCDGCGKRLTKIGQHHEEEWIEGDRSPGLCGIGKLTTLIDPEDVEEAFRAFRESHPGLVDMTFTCQRCDATAGPNPAGMFLIREVVCGEPMTCPECAEGGREK